MKLKLTGISQKGKNRIKEGLGSVVVVLREFDDRFLVAPEDKPTMDSRFLRNIAKTDDPHFTFEVLN